MSSGDPRHDWMRQYAQGTASAETTLRLEQALRGDAAFRKLFLEYLNVDLALAGTPGLLNSPVTIPARWFQGSRPLALAAAIVIIIGLAAVWWWPERAIVTLAQSSGAVSWCAEGGEWKRALPPGAQLRAGTLSVEGGQNSAQLVFRDGSTVTLTGESEAVFSERSQKVLVLRSGALTADVRPQPSGHPLLVRTPTAQIEVVGTHFSLAHQHGQTTLAVLEGKVRLFRLADRSSVDVETGQKSTATLDVAAPLEIRQLNPAPARWRQTFDQAPAPIWQGEWLPPDAANPGRLRNVLDVSQRREDSTVVPAYVVAVRDNSGELAAVQPDSQLRLRLRTAKPVNLVVLLGLHHPTGGFAGNFQADFRPQDIRSDATGWCELQIPMTKLRAGMKDHPTIPPGARVFLVYVACYFPGAGLEISEMSINPPAAP